MVDIVIVNWNSADYLNKCVHSILFTDNRKYVNRIYIIDNHSTDNSLQISEDAEKIVIIKNPENEGFSKACNIGFKLCCSPFILLLNPDAQVLDRTLPDCINFMSQHSDLDILGCRLLNEQGNTTTSCSRFPTPGRIFIDSTGLPKIAPRIFKPGVLMTNWNHKESRIVDQVMGAFMFIRSSVFEKIGFFDEQFFVYYEEVDFSKRLARAGGKTFFNTDIRAIHSGEGTTRNVKAFRLFLNLHSRLLYAKKHFSRAGYLIVWLCTFFIEPITRGIHLLISGRVYEIGDVLKGYKLLTRMKGKSCINMKN